MKCPNYYDSTNEFCKNHCEHVEECKEDCYNYAVKHLDEYPQIKLNV